MLGALLTLLQQDPINLKAVLESSYSWRDGVTWLIGIATFIVVLWYTAETRKMQKAVREQVTAANAQSEILRGQALTLNKQAEAMNAQIEASRQQIAVMQQQTAVMNRQIDASQQQTAELIHQRRLSIMPALTTQIVRLDIPANEASMSDLGYRLCLTNAGNGAALAIQIDPVLIDPSQSLPEEVSDKVSQEKGEIFFASIAFLGKGDVITTTHTGQIGGRKVKVDLLVNLFENNLWKHSLPVHFRFQDIEGNQYEQTILTGKGGCRPGAVKQIPSE